MVFGCPEKQSLDELGSPKNLEASYEENEWKAIRIYT